MPSLPHKVTNISAATTSVSGIEFTDAITLVTFNQTSTDTTWIPISGNVQSTTGVPVWTATVEFGQDLAATTTFTNFLLNNHGKSTTIIFKPAGATQAVTATVVLKAPAQLGGGVGVATSSAEFAVNGQPSITVGAS
ncbi:hypothetical protein [Paenarthrobacter sp. NPDC057981]|uniref:hypothetical protein n=1 Tax=Paenarthrobacter sp. NPDC057981 TaxID=3346297 RepID=UPI0036DF96F3